INPIAPITCFETATRLNLASSSAVDLCAGAVNDGPSLCFAQLEARNDLAQQYEIALCRGATSTGPADCYASIADARPVADLNIVGYCAPYCSPGYPYPAAWSDPSCFIAASHRAWLPDSSAAELCSGSTSTAPVGCFLAGKQRTTLAELELIRLCAVVTAYACYPAGYY